MSNLCRLIFVLLLLLLCNCVVPTTTKWYMKHNKNKNKKINLHTFSIQWWITFCCCCCFCCYSVILLLQKQNYTWEMPRAVLCQVSLTCQLDICSQMYPAQMSDEKNSSLLLVPLCHNISDWCHKDMCKLVCREIVHITFLYIACKNMWLGGVDTNVHTVTKNSAKCI